MITEAIASGLILSFLAGVPCLAQGTVVSPSPAGPVARSQARVQARIVGELRLADGSAVAGALVSADGVQTTSDANGFFSIFLDVTLGQEIVVSGAARIVGVNHRGSASVRMRKTRVDVGSITLERRSVPLYLSPLEHLGEFGVSAYADFDGDGDADLLGASGLLENGPDGFVETPFSLGVDGFRFEPLDLDQDGDVDLLVTHNGALGWELSAFLNDGQGHFGNRLPVADLNGFEVNGDFDGDTFPDLVLITSGTLSFLRGNGDGTFAMPQGEAAPMAGPSLAADLDGDGVLDLAVASGNQLAILLGNGDGTFGAATSHSLANGVHSLSSGDLDGDGRVDLLAVTSLTVFPASATYFTESLLGQGGGLFGAGATTALGTTFLSASLGELSGDGRSDLVLGEKASSLGITSGWLRVRRGRGNGGFFSSNTTYPIGEQLRVIAVEDFDEDGRLDVIANGYGQGGWGITFTFGRGNGTLASHETLTGTTRAASASDFDLDGDLDLLLLDPVANRAQLSLGSGSGQYSPVFPAVDLQPEGHQATGDLDGDGDLDVVVIHELTRAAILLHDGSGHLSLASSFVVGSDPRPVLEDFDHDGDLDLAVSSSSNGGQVSLYLGNGDGTFAAPAVLPAGGSPASLVAGDWDSDSAPDLVLQLPAQLAYWGGNGDGTFQAAVGLAASGGFFGPRSVSDVDGDGALDLVTSQAVLLGRGDGSFDPALPNGIGSEDAFDVDDDGRLDLLSSASGAVRLHLGNGDGTFSSALTYAEPWDEEPFEFYVAAPLLGDLDGDGDADLLLRYLDPAAPGFSYILRGRRVP